MTLKLSKRKDIKSDNYWLRGVFQYAGKKHTVANKTTYETSYSKAKEYQEYYEDILRHYLTGKCDIKGNSYITHEVATVFDCAELTKKRKQKPTSEKTNNLINKVCDFEWEKGVKFGDLKANEVSNEMIQELGFKMYPMPKELETASDTDLNEQEKRKKSSRLNTMNRCVICPLSLILHHGASLKPKLCDYMVVNRYTLVKRPPVYFTNEEFDRCLSVPALFQIKLLFVFLCYTGARLHEALNVKWSDIKEVAPDEDGTRNYEVHLWEGKGDKGRNVFIHETLKEWLDQVNDRGIFLFQWRKAWDNKKENEGLYENWYQMLDAAKIDNEKPPHKCRHTFATWGRKAGWTLEDLQEVGGWKDRKSVEVYAHIMPETKVSRIKELPAAIKTLPSPNNIMKILPKYAPQTVHAQ